MTMLARCLLLATAFFFRFAGETMAQDLEPDQHHSEVPANHANAKFGAAELTFYAHLRLAVGNEATGSYVVAGLSVVASPLPRLLFEGRAYGLLGEGTRSATGLMLVRVVEFDDAAVALGSGIEWVEEVGWSNARAAYLVEGALRVPAELALEIRLTPLFTVRPYFGAAVAPWQQASEVYDYQVGLPRQTTSRLPTEVYLGISAGVGWVHPRR